ncbi:hypothetical protein GCM10025857_36390 [Alicyclobacillus contaminans]|uniref:hypothetical protein n=1 Tax=Alicyclobacillus contaminans TaxID=392016 RepID=UPI00040DF5AC|nr:hypothetical protein [Alicyclobacillus contaminans]GMA52282.1 hypothetical protein GCM10025857_36390 [Alicyclobacillus contaminans]
MKTSPRTPGYAFRHFDAHRFRADAVHMLHKYDIRGNHETTIPPRTADGEDAERIGDRGKRSPLK